MTKLKGTYSLLEAIRPHISERTYWKLHKQIEIKERMAEYKQLTQGD